MSTRTAALILTTAILSAPAVVVLGLLLLPAPAALLLGLATWWAIDRAARWRWRLTLLAAALLIWHAHRNRTNGDTK